jgi:Zn-dependent metalloprotease
MCVRHPHHSLFCIVPPNILRSIAERGTPEQRVAATQTLTMDSTLRAIRSSRLALEGAPPISARVATGQKQRRIFDAQNDQQLPGVPVRSEGQAPTGDVGVNESYDGLGATWDFFWDAYGRDSINDEGLPLDATVHFGVRYNNAFWNSAQMVFGDGDGQIFNRFTISIDVIGHELTHGVTEDEAQLQYLFQSGALNESMSDVFGSLVKQYHLNETASQADWLIGEGLFTSAIQGKALRSMKAPGTAYNDPLIGKDPQPAHMKDYVNTYDDNGGVHINSGIPNRAFYLAATNLGGVAWDKAGRIWYETLRDSRLRANSGFTRFARLTVSTAVRLYGHGCTEESAVADAWKQVGITVSGVKVAAA